MPLLGELRSATLSRDSCCLFPRDLDRSRLPMRGASPASLGLIAILDCCCVGVRRPLTGALSLVAGLSLVTGDMFSLSNDCALEVSTAGPNPRSGRVGVRVLDPGGVGKTPLGLGVGACCCGGGPGGPWAIDTRGSLDPGPSPGPDVTPLGGPRSRSLFAKGPVAPVLSGGPCIRLRSLPSAIAPGASLLGLLGVIAPFSPGRRLAIPRSLGDVPDGTCGSFGGYRILAVSRMYTRLNSAASRGAELGSPPRTTICLPLEVIL